MIPGITEGWAALFTTLFARQNTNAPRRSSTPHVDQLDDRMLRDIGLTDQKAGLPYPDIRSTRDRLLRDVMRFRRI